MKDKEFWIKLLVSSVIPLALGTGTIFAFSLFEERLPDWAYDTLVIMFYIFFCIFLAVFAVMLIRLAIGEWIGILWSLLKKRRERKRLKERLQNWSKNFSELSDLIINVSKNDWKATDSQKEKYSEIHAWFKIGRSRILPHWQYFENKRTQPANIGWSLSQSDLEWVVLIEHNEDPFSVFYEQLTLGFLESSLKRWNANVIIYVLNKLVELTFEFNVWTLARYD